MTNTKTVENWWDKNSNILCFSGKEFLYIDILRLGKFFLDNQGEMIIFSIKK